MPSIFGKFGTPKSPFGRFEIPTPLTQLKGSKVFTTEKDILNALGNIIAATEEPLWVTLTDSQKEPLKQDVLTWTESQFEEVRKKAKEVLAKF